MSDRTNEYFAKIAAREIEARYRLMLENSADFITVIALDGTILFESASVDQLGYAPEVLIGKNLAEYVHPDDLKSALESIQRLSQSQEAIERDCTRFRRQDGAWRWLDVTARYVSELFGPGGAILVNSRDVTDRRHIQDELKKTQIRLKSAQSLGRVDDRAPCRE